MEAALQRIPDVCFGTDVMVGFPGEGEREFANTRALVQDLPFAYLHVFSYSPRPGTAAVKLPEPVPSPVVKARSQELRDISRRQRTVFYQRMVGKTVDVLFETQEAEGFWSGLTDNYVRVAVRSGSSLENHIRQVHVTGAMADRVVGFLAQNAEGPKERMMPESASHALPSEVWA